MNRIIDDYNQYTLEDFVNIYELMGECVLINDGKVVGFENENDHNRSYGH